MKKAQTRNSMTLCGRPGTGFDQNLPGISPRPSKEKKRLKKYIYIYIKSVLCNEHSEIKLWLRPIRWGIHIITTTLIHGETISIDLCTPRRETKL